jgi:hypothetical protein
MNARKVTNACSPSRLRRQGIRQALILAMMCVAVTGGEMAVGGTKVSYEKQPVLQASQLAPAELLQGRALR